MLYSRKRATLEFISSEGVGVEILPEKEIVVFSDVHSEYSAPLDVEPLKEFKPTKVTDAAGETRRKSYAAALLELRPHLLIAKDEKSQKTLNILTKIRCQWHYRIYRDQILCDLK